MPDHAEFVRAIHDTRMSGDGENPGPDLVYADWLDERGDPLGRLIRESHRQGLDYDQDPPAPRPRAIHLVEERGKRLGPGRDEPAVRAYVSSLTDRSTGTLIPDLVRVSADLYHPDTRRFVKSYHADFHPQDAIDVIRGMNLDEDNPHNDPPAILAHRLHRAGIRWEPRREARRRYALQQATSYPLAARIARSRNSRSLAMIASKVLSRLDLHPHATNHALHDDGRAVTPDVISVVGGRQQDPARVRYAAAWYGLVADRPGVLAFTPRPGGPHALYRLDLKGKASDLRAAMDRAGLKQRVLVPRQHGFSVYVFDQDGSYRDRVADLATRAGVQVAAAEGDGEVMGHPDDQGKARESYRAVTRAAEQPQQMARRRYATAGSSKPSHEPFIAEILKHPGDDGPAQVYADWLQEQGHPLGDIIRADYPISDGGGVHGHTAFYDDEFRSGHFTYGVGRLGDGRAYVSATLKHLTRRPGVRVPVREWVMPLDERSARQAAAVRTSYGPELTDPLERWKRNLSFHLNRLGVRPLRDRRRYAAADDTWQWHATTLQDLMRRAAASTQDLPGDLSDYIDRIGQLPAAGERINRILAAQIVRHTPAGDGRLFDLLDEPGRRAVETAERHAHGLATDDELAEAHASLGGETARTPEGAARSAARAASGPDAAEAANLAARHASLAADWSGGGGSAEAVHKRMAKALYYAPKPAGLKRVAFSRRGPVRRYSSHEEFHKAIAENPDDPHPALVYADWLDEQGDPAGEVIREHVKRREAERERDRVAGREPGSIVYAYVPYDLRAFGTHHVAGYSVNMATPGEGVRVVLPGVQFRGQNGNLYHPGFMANLPQDRLWQIANHYRLRLPSYKTRGPRQESRAGRPRRYSHEAILKTIAEDPRDKNRHLVFADHLEEQGHPLGAFVRAAAEWRDVSGLGEGARGRLNYLEHPASVNVRKTTEEERQTLSRHLHPDAGADLGIHGPLHVFVFTGSANRPRDPGSMVRLAAYPVGYGWSYGSQMTPQRALAYAKSLGPEAYKALGRSLRERNPDWRAFRHMQTELVGQYQGGHLTGDEDNYRDVHEALGGPPGIDFVRQWVRDRYGRMDQDRALAIHENALYLLHRWLESGGFRRYIQSYGVTRD